MRDAAEWKPMMVGKSFSNASLKCNLKYTVLENPGRDALQFIAGHRDAIQKVTMRRWDSGVVM